MAVPDVGSSMALGMAQTLRTATTDLFGIKHPIILAGMNAVASPRLCAAVTNAGGLGVIGGGMYTPEQMAAQIDETRSFLNDKNAPFGVDLLIPKVGEGARATNYDYLKGNLDKLIEIIIEKKVALFVCAVGLAPPHVVKRLHEGGVLYMNMCGAPKHAVRAAQNGADLVCATGNEAGGHTGEIPTMILIPAVHEAIKGIKSPYTGKQVQLIAGGGLYNGRTVAAALALGADAVWVGTRFILSEESGASKQHKQSLLRAGHGDVIRSTIFTGRPLHSLATPYLRKWEEERRAEMIMLQNKGIIPVHHDLELHPDDDEVLDGQIPILMGKVAPMVKEDLPASKIVEELTTGAAAVLGQNRQLVSAKL